MNFVTTDQLTQLRCLKCKNYLSYFPVHLSDNPPGSICGRCSKPVKDSNSRNMAYEEIAALQKFPCRYDTDGCLENLHPNDVPLHETFCRFRKYDCPTSSSTRCKWQGLASDMQYHFQQKHAIFTIRDGGFEVDFVGNYCENHLLNFEDEIYIVKETSKNRTFSCIVYYLGSNTYAANYSYKLTLQNAFYRDITTVIIKSVGDETLIDRQLMVESLRNPSGVIAQIEILKPEEKDEEQYEEVQWQLVGELECCCCMEYMLPPVQQCIIGHSICSSCKQTQEVCPTCTKEFQNTVNITLGHLIDHLIYPCKNSPEGCRFACKAINIRKHESNCTYGKFKCPLNDYEGCNDKIAYANLYDHIVNNHYENLLEMDVVCRPLKNCSTDDEDEGEEVEDKTENEDCFILRYNFRLFKLHFKYEFGTFYWEMQQIGVSKKNEKYEFEISFRDDNRRICLRTNCGTLSDKDEAFGEEKPFISVDFDQIRNMIKDELLTYHVHVLPKS